MSPTPLRVRREPPPFRRVEVRRVERRSPRMVAVTLGGDGLDGFALDHPAASVRLLLPSPGDQELVVPAWNGNEFLLPDGRRPAIRTLTPRRFDAHTRELDVEVVLHGGGVAAAWAARAERGDPAALSGPGRGYAVPEAPALLLAGDESAIPAISQLLECVPDDRRLTVHVEVARRDARLPLPDHPRATVHWHDLPPGAPPGEALVAAVRSEDLDHDARVWAAGEAAGVQRIRRYLFDEVGLPRSATTVRGYWKHGRAGDAGDDA